MTARLLLITAMGAALVLGLASSAMAQEATVVAGDRFAERGGQPGAFEHDGRLSLRDVYSFDNQTEFDVHILFLDADYRAKRVAKVGDGDLNLRLDSRFLLDLTQDNEIQSSTLTPPRKLNERRFGETQTVYDIRIAYAELASLGNFDLTGGRQWFYEAGGAWVDGASMRYHINKTWSTALYGGLGPNPADYTFDADRQTVGGFLSHEGKRLQFSLAYTAQLYTGEPQGSDVAEPGEPAAESELLDRHFLFSRGHWAPTVTSTKSLFLSYYLSLDLQGEEPVVTTFFTNSSWWLNDMFNVTAHFARYANSVLKNPGIQRQKPEENQRELLNAAGTYDQVRLSTGQRFGTYFTYQQIDYRQRDVIDQTSAVYYRGGVRTASLLGTGLSGNTRLTVRNNFASDSLEMLVEGGYRFADAFDLEAAFAYQSGRSLAKGLDGQLVENQRQDVYLFDIVGTLDITPKVYLSLDYELSNETNIAQEELETAGDLTVHTVFTRLTYRL